MRVQKRNPWLFSLGVVLAAMALSGSRAEADVISDRPGSVVIWPKVIADGTRDTLITLTNTRNEEAYAHCEYTNGIGFCTQSGAYCTLPSVEAPNPAFPACPGGPTDVCDLRWQTLDFDVILTRQQPTIWRVSTGRRDDPLQTPDAECEPDGTSQNCPGFFNVGQVLAPAQPFAGELRCVQTARDGSALNANGLKGEATIETIAVAAIGLPPPAGIPVLSAQISKYNSINVRAVRPPSGDPSILPLNGVDPANAEDFNVYNACPEAVEFTNYAVGADDLAAATIEPAVCAPAGCPVRTEITVVPCRVDFEREIPTLFTLNIVYHNEFEQLASVGGVFNCWTNFTLEQLGFTNVAGSTFQRTRIHPEGSGLCIEGAQSLLNTPCDEDADCVTIPGANGVCAPPSGVLAIVEEFHYAAASLAPGSTIVPGTDAANAYGVDTNEDGFVGRLGRCRGALDNTRCAADNQCVGSGCDNGACPTGRCRFSGASCSNVDPVTLCALGDFCDQCMNDEIRYQPDVITPIPPMP